MRPYDSCYITQISYFSWCSFVIWVTRLVCAHQAKHAPASNMPRTLGYSVARCRTVQKCKVTEKDNFDVDISELQKLAHHQIFPATTIRAVRRFLKFPSRVLFSSRSRSFPLARDLSFSRAVSFFFCAVSFLLARLRFRILTLSCDVQASHLNVTFSLRHCADV